ncbi:uncharacterized protein LOC132738283 [Ruditapes philippinarum]|uniref:uncharacterized protein LOC132738283 n=1 Tax=Ruditapes philippinarum TaxID=129788 RepID=UPI00295C287E|nr:uncharacterized protein LOC132738283 [Ruditapes philippinarum]
MKVSAVFGYLKQRGHVLFSISGVCCLILTLSVISLSNNLNDHRYNEISQHLSEMKNRAISKQDEIAETKRKKREADEDVNIRQKGGAVYIRWGRTTCPGSGANTELVYSGIAGGSYYTHLGAATNLQCLPNDPVWGRYTDTAGSAFMYGMEFEESLDGLIDTSNIQKPLLNHNVPCVVCRSKKRISSLMVPGKFDCFPGWNFEYHGYLMAGSHGHKAGTSYICIDQAPQADPAGYRDENGALLYRVTAQCGSLPCPNYVQNRELPCSVCTK